MVVLVTVAFGAIALIALWSAARAALQLRRRRRAAHDPRDEWWPQFEEAFREYARRSSDRMPGD
jgi:hypothetical protein